jgi:hypothetical protein
MIAANAYGIRFATRDDPDTLTGLAERAAEQPLVGRVLIGYIDGKPAAALSLHDRHVIGDPALRTGHLAAVLRMRADAIEAFEATPSLPDRLRVAFASWRRGAIVVPAPVSRSADAEQEPTRKAA